MLAIPADATIPQLVQAAAARHPQAVALVGPRAGRWEPTTYAELAEAVECIALGLAELGVRAGDRVALLGPNRPEWTLVDQAVLHLGAVTVPIYDTVPPADQAFVVADAGARTLVVADAARWARLAPLRASMPDLRDVVLLAGEAEGAARLAEVSAKGRARREADPDAFARAWKAVRADDVATFVYTSGTTGRPKGVVLTHRNFASNVAGVSGIVPFGPGDRTVSFLPLSHSLQRAAEFAVLAHGAAIWYAEGLDRLPEAFAAARPTVLVGVPRVWEKVHRTVLEKAARQPPRRRRLFDRALAGGLAVVAAADKGRRASLADRAWAAFGRRVVFRELHARFGGRVRYLVSGGAPLAPDLERFFWAAGMPLLSGYGLTEAGPVLTLNAIEGHRTGTVGRPMRGVELRLAEDGEILARSPGIARGYWNRPEDTAATFVDGWLHTGDVGVIDPDGHVRVTGRKKEILVKSNGKKVAPAPVEKALEAQPEIAQAVLLGEGRSWCAALVVPDPAAFGGRPGEALAADPGVRAAVEAAVARVNAGLAAHEQVKRVALLPRELTAEAGELTPTLKVKRGVVADRYAPLVEELYRTA